MIFASSNILGIAVTDRAIAIAEVSGKGDSRMVRRAATFTLPAELSFDNPTDVGQALGRFLQENGFSAKRAVVGLPAKWIVAVEKEIPPASKEQVKELLRLQAERLSIAEGGDAVFDYAGVIPSGKPGKVLLVAVLRKQLEKVTSAIDAAGVSIVAATPTALALANAAAQPAKQGQPMVLLGRHGAEIVWQPQGTPRMLKHFSVPVTNGQVTPALGALGMELRRAVTMGAGMVPEVVLWDAIGLDSAQLGELSEKTGMKVRSGDNLAMLGVKTLVRSGSPSTADESSPQRYAAAVALAVVGAQPSLLPLDFIDSRLAPPKVRRFGRKAVWSAAAAALVVLLIGWLIVDTQLEQKKLDDLKARRVALTPQYNEVKKIKDQVDFSNLYFKERAPALDCMKEITMIFAQEPFLTSIWAMNFNFKEDRDGRDLDKLEGTIDGKTTDTLVPWAVADQMRGNPKFSNVVPSNIMLQSANRQQRETLFTYTIKFTFNQNPSMAPTTGPAK